MLVFQLTKVIFFVTDTSLEVYDFAFEKKIGKTYEEIYVKETSFAFDQTFNFT